MTSTDTSIAAAALAYIAVHGDYYHSDPYNIDAHWDIDNAAGALGVGLDYTMAFASIGTDSRRVDGQRWAWLATFKDGSQLVADAVLGTYAVTGPDRYTRRNTRHWSRSY